ncbi:MAG TPA: chemotaxis protein CheW [Acidimicrobiales bacterium]|nr:chemotaxis protein CheW [Acidimicrobiales bacterium]
MRQLVRFRTSAGSYAVPVEHAREVRSGDGLRPLPSPRAGVAGVVSRGDDAVPVLDSLGGGGGHILMLEAGNNVFGLLVEQVTGVESFGDDAVAPPPPGQDDAVIAGVVQEGDVMVLVVDVPVLAQSLRS